MSGDDFSCTNLQRVARAVASSLRRSKRVTLSPKSGPKIAPRSLGIAGDCDSPEAISSSIIRSCPATERSSRLASSFLASAFATRAPQIQPTPAPNKPASREIERIPTTLRTFDIGLLVFAALLPGAALQTEVAEQDRRQQKRDHQGRQRGAFAQGT